MQNNCYHVDLFRDSIQFEMQLDHVLKKLNFDLFTSSPGWLGIWGSRDKIFATS